MNEKKRVLITGATSGIGQAICREFAKQGFHILAQARNEAKGVALVRELTERTTLELVLGDLSDPQTPQRVIDYATKDGAQLDVLVNAAGGVMEPVIEPGTAADPLETYQVNVFAAYALSVLAAPHLRNGCIVNISSVFAASPWGALYPHYSAAKAALTHLTTLLAIKLAPVRVNSVSPGRTLTPAWGEPDASHSAALTADTLIKRWITPAEIADAVYFLARNKACTGTDVLIDGGMSLSPAVTNT